MSLRPRYSLLTLLALTALIAGGVKLWYGPHHVVERPSKWEELEFTYMRNLSGERILQGPNIRRLKYTTEGEHAVVVSYYRDGTVLPWKGALWWVKTEAYHDTHPFIDGRCILPGSPLTPAEHEDFRMTIDGEKKYKLAYDFIICEYEGE